MKLHKRLWIDHQEVRLVQEEVRLELNNPGKALFTVHARQPLQGLVRLEVGYNDGPLVRHFSGQVEHCITVNDHQQRVYCREYTQALQAAMPLALRHVDLGQVLAEMSQLSGLTIYAPDATYSKRRVPYFYSLGNGLQAVDSIRQVFAIDDFVWQQESDDRVFVGAWADSQWGNRNALTLPPELFESHHGNQSAQIAVMPGLRPGASFNFAQRIVSITLSDSKMALRWKTP